MDLILCALLLLSPQTKPETYQCKLIGFDRTPILVCNDKEKTVLEIPYSEWPEEWEGPHLGTAYLVNAKDWTPLRTVVDPKVIEATEKKSRNEQLRWHRPPLQKPGR